MTSDSSRAVALVGAGNMGGGMARNLLARGWQVRVHDIDRPQVDALAREGAVPCAHAAQAAGGVALTIVCVVDSAQCEEVLFAPGGVCERPGGVAGHTVMLCPTIGPGDTERLAARLDALGAGTIDAPMSGGPVRAAEGSMSLMVACDEALFEDHRGLIEALSSRVFRLGARVGDGARAKLVNNLLAGINLVGAAEALVIAQRMGLDAARMLEVIEQSSGQSWIGSDRMRRALAGDYEPRAHLTLLEKDTGLALQAARSLGLEGPLGAAAHEVFVRAHEAGLAGLDDAAVFRWLAQAMAAPR
ncbi:MAG: NAD(P)-dependent oxidoreductase [Rubrivivax sp.]